jgi:RsiW-degrading membrane proteinase PrsW (M82 family)
VGRRALITWPTLGTYGVNPWVFLAIDVVTAPPYGIAQALTVKILRDRTRPPRDALVWGVLVVVMFLAPYIYILAASGEQMPLIAYVLVGAWAVVFGTLAVLRMRKQIKAPDQPTV